MYSVRVIVLFVYHTDLWCSTASIAQYLPRFLYHNDRVLGRWHCSGAVYGAFSRNTSYDATKINTTITDRLRTCGLIDNSHRGVVNLMLKGPTFPIPENFGQSKGQTSKMYKEAFIQIETKDSQPQRRWCHKQL